MTSDNAAAGRPRWGGEWFPCTCGEKHQLTIALWHIAYCHWYDHDRAGHRRRAAVWGKLTNWASRIGD